MAVAVSARGLRAFALVLFAVGFVLWLISCGMKQQYPHGGKHQPLKPGALRADRP